MHGDDKHDAVIAALWALLAAGPDSDPADLREMAAAAAAAIHAARGADAFVWLHERGGVLHLNGRKLRLAMESFPAAQGLAQQLQRRGICELLFDASVTVADLLPWAAAWQAGTAAGCSAASNAIQQTVEQAGSTAQAPLPLPERSPAAAGTRLPSIYLQHQLMAHLPLRWWLPPVATKLVLQQIVEHLLVMPGGRDPLLLLERDSSRLATALRVAIQSVVLLRVAGWPDSQLAAAGAIALLADLGPQLANEAPDQAAFYWLLQRGDAPFWREAAVVARSWRTVAAADLDDLAAGDGLLPAVVRLAVALDQHAAWDGTAEALARAVASCALPVELLAVAEEAFRCDSVASCR